MDNCRVENPLNLGVDMTGNGGLAGVLDFRCRVSRKDHM